MTADTCVPYIRNAYYMRYVCVLMCQCQAQNIASWSNVKTVKSKRIE